VIAASSRQFGAGAKMRPFQRVAPNQSDKPGDNFHGWIMIKIMIKIKIGGARSKF
jgi:hypothetical protein